MRTKDLRKAKGLTQDQLAVALDVKQSTVAMWEIGQRVPKTSMLPRLAKALGCRIDDLFEEMDEKAIEAKTDESGMIIEHGDRLSWWRLPDVDDEDMSWLQE